MKNGYIRSSMELMEALKGRKKGSLPKVSPKKREKTMMIYLFPYHATLPLHRLFP